MHEAQLHADNSFITLTYNESNLPSGGTLVHQHFQEFMKRLRKRCGQMRYYMCGEYGSAEDGGLGRPHYHALLFGYDFPDKRHHTTENGNPLYISKVLKEVWGKGHCLIGGVTFKSAAYVARYLMKKQTGDLAQAHYVHIDEYTGEIINRKPEYTHMSLKPGIGADWFTRFRDDVFPDDFCIIQGRRYRVPRFYDKLMKRSNDEIAKDMHDEVCAVRQLRARNHQSDNSDARLAVRERTQEARLQRLRRELK